jgi:glycosyltransferase involved in cell wall biosynthesis
VIALLHGLRAYGAVERYVGTIVEGLRGARERVALVFPDDPVLTPFRELEGDNVEVVPVPVELEEGPAPQLVAHLTGVLRRLRPRLVHVMDVWPAALVAARLAGVRRLLMTHHTPELPRADNLAGRAWWELGWLTRPEVVYTSESDRRTDGRRLRSHVVYYGIDLERFSSGTPALDIEGRLVGNVARLAPQKGQRYLVEAAPLVLERHPDVRFVIVGDGELRGRLGELARATGVDERFVFTGEREDVPNLLASFDVFAFPSLFEGLCLAVIEAQAAGVPVVATPVGGIRETVVPGVTGLYSTPRDARSLATQIDYLLDNPAEGRRMADEARRRVFRQFSEARMVQETIALYA